MMLAAIYPHFVMMFFGLVLIIFVGGRALLKIAARQMLDDFRKRYPGECPVCSFHRYGVQQGHLRSDEPVGKHPRCANANPQNCPGCGSPCFFTHEGNWIGCGCPEAQCLPYGGVEQT